MKTNETTVYTTSCVLDAKKSQVTHWTKLEYLGWDCVWNTIPCKRIKNILRFRSDQRNTHTL